MQEKKRIYIFSVRPRRVPGAPPKSPFGLEGANWIVHISRLSVRPRRAPGAPPEAPVWP
jgi:hypothetical protein